MLLQARFWVQVMRDLRNGVKLKKVQERQYNPLPIEYQLTPYEMLMDDIRSRRYTLRKVMVSNRKLFMDSNGWFLVILLVKNLFTIMFQKVLLLIKLMHGLYGKVGKYNKLKKKSYKCVISQLRQKVC